MAVCPHFVYMIISCKDNSSRGKNAKPFHSHCKKINRPFNKKNDSFLFVVPAWLSRNKKRYGVAQRYIDRVGARRKFAKNYTFINRQRGTKSLIIIIAGFQPYYWTTLLSNVHKANSAKRDVCICIPLGGANPRNFIRLPSSTIGRCYI